MATNVLLIFPQPSQTSPQKSPPLSILHVGEALREAKQRGVSDETYRVRYFDERYDEPPDIGWADVVGVSSITGYQLRGAIQIRRICTRRLARRNPLAQSGKGARQTHDPGRHPRHDATRTMSSRGLR